jgi:hypothetical protein
LCHGCYAEEKNGSAASELRCRCAWLHHGSGPRAHRIQGCGAIDPRPKASSPLIAIPTAPSVPSCSKLSRCGLATAGHAVRLVRRPTLTASARAGVSKVPVGTKKRASRSNKETDERSRCASVPKLLDKQSPIQGTSGSNREAESTDAPERGGLPRSSAEAPSRRGTSRMTRECQVRICERLGVKFPGPTRPSRRFVVTRKFGRYWRHSRPERAFSPGQLGRK